MKLVVVVCYWSTLVVRHARVGQTLQRHSLVLGSGRVGSDAASSVSHPLLGDGVGVGRRYTVGQQPGRTQQCTVLVTVSVQR